MGYLDIPDDMRDKFNRFLDYLGIKELNPVQEKAIKTGYLRRENLVVASPTGSGKTLIAELAMLGRRKVVYTCPLRALASEKYKEFRIFEKFGKTIAISIGDLDSSDSWLDKYDIIITTNEKLDSLMRHNSPWLRKVDLLVIDEVHLLDTDRGPTLENIIMRFKYLYPRTQIIALSATIPNVDDISGWLGATPVVSDWRPVELELGVYTNGIAETTGGTYEIEQRYKDELKNVVDHFLDDGKNIIVFTQTRRSAEATADQLKSIVSKHINGDGEYVELSKRVLSALETPTKQCKRLASCVLDGVAFHHAGLVNEQRAEVENAFRDGTLRVVCATPTLAMGVNLPADVVIMRTTSRYTGSGMDRIKRREFLQCAGRAGRPQYSDKGIALLMAKSESEKETLWQTYINGRPEDVVSQLSREPILRTHVLASVSMEITNSREKLYALFMHSLMAHQYGGIEPLKPVLDRTIESLERWGFIESSGNKIEATRLGKRVSELYIDPYSAKKILDKLKNANFGEIGWLYLIADTDELRPYLNIRRGEEESIWEKAVLMQDSLGANVTDLGFDDYLFLEKFKTALMLRDWINEKTEEGILEEYNIAPGILRMYVSNSDWIAYSAEELAKISLGKNGSHVLKEIERLRLRIKYGVKEELIPLVRLRGVGRVKARRLYNLGIKFASDIKNFENKKLLETAIGKKTLDRIMGGLDDR